MVVCCSLCVGVVRWLLFVLCELMVLVVVG